MSKRIDFDKLAAKLLTVPASEYKIVNQGEGTHHVYEVELSGLRVELGKLHKGISYYRSFEVIFEDQRIGLEDLEGYSEEKVLSLIGKIETKYSIETKYDEAQAKKLAEEERRREAEMVNASKKREQALTKLEKLLET